MMFRVLFLLFLFLFLSHAATTTATVTSAEGHSSLPIVVSDATAIRLGISSDSSPGQQQIVHGDSAKRIGSMPSIDSLMSSTTQQVGGTTGATLWLSSPEGTISGVGDNDVVISSPNVREEGGTDDDSDDIRDVEVEPIVIVLFMFFGLGTGIIIMQLLSVVGGSILTNIIVILSWSFHCCLSICLSVCFPTDILQVIPYHTPA